MDIQQLWDSYHTLELPNGSTDEEVKVAYRKLASKYNPGGLSGDVKKFTEVNKAYKFLTGLSQQEKQELEKTDRLIAKSFVNPKQFAKDIEEEHKQRLNAEKERIKAYKRAPDHTLRNSFLCLLLIPVSIVFWNLHPVLGIISLVVFFICAYNLWFL